MKNTLFTLILALPLAACSQSAEKGAQVAAEEEKVPVVAAVKAVVEKVPQDAEYSSTILANVVNNIAPQSVGRIQTLNVEVGDFVKAGQELARMDCVQLDQAELRLKNSEDELNRARSLFQEGGISQSDFEQLELSYKVSKSSFDNLKENTVLCSPVDGVISARNYDRGDMYGMSAPIYVVQQIVPVKLLVGISETDYTRVKAGDAVSVSADALPGKTFKGRISRIYPVIDASTHTFNVEVKVGNENRLLRPGMYARAVVDFGSTLSVVVPDVAVQKQQGSGVRTVYVVGEDSVIGIKTVTLGRHFDGKYEILSGLAEGETVVTKGFSALRSGIKVNVQ